MQPRLFILCLMLVSQASAQTWFTANTNKNTVTTIENDYLVTKISIKILDPPKIDKLEVLWDRTTGYWNVVLTSINPLEAAYIPCRFALGDWNGLTIGAGHRDGGSFLMLVPRSYEHAIKIRDALIKQLKLAPDKISTEPKDAEKILN